MRKVTCLTLNEYNYVFVLKVWRHLISLWTMRSGLNVAISMTRSEPGLKVSINVYYYEVVTSVKVYHSICKHMHCNLL